MNVVALSGGVGGARLVDGLAQVLPPESLTVIVNTGDDFEHWGLWISPDLDTVMYTLAGVGDTAQGWGRADESFRALEEMSRLGAASWFRLGDRDLATHLFRTQALRSGETLTTVTGALCRALGVRATILPMCDAPRPTLVEVPGLGALDFQSWLVRHRGPAPSAVRLAVPPPPTPAVMDALAACDLVIIGPSNPYVSVDPITTLPGVAELLAKKTVVAVSPLIGGRAVKGPLAEMIPALAGRPADNEALRDHYARWLRGLVVAHGERVPGLSCLETETLMRTPEDRRRLARETLDFAGTL